MELEFYPIKDVFSFVPKRFVDDRGEFFESFNQQKFEEVVGQKINFVQDNQSVSLLNTIRGLHFQAPPFAQGKLVRVVFGKVLDVAVDIRKNSPTYGQHIAVELSAENNKVLWIPEGFAHGFSALQNNAVFLYKCTRFYHKESEDCILYNSPELEINWKVDNPLLSEKDKTGISFNHFKTPFL